MHCYGQPCDVNHLQNIADNYNLRLVYDAAHAFKVEVDGKSILNFGDLSVLSFHATKVFNTFEGGAIISPDTKTKQRIDRLKNFGYVDEQTVVAPGINGKMSEFNAALGIVQIQYADQVLERRKAVANRYIQRLKLLKGIRIVESTNHSYFPILITAAYPLTRDELYNRFRESNIWVRKYFSPLLTEFPMYRDFPSADPKNLPNAINASRNILCLPLFPSLSNSEQDRVLKILESA